MGPHSKPNFISFYTTGILTNLIFWAKFLIQLVLVWRAPKNLTFPHKNYVIPGVTVLSAA
jgi:hypothetical protein